MRLPVSFNQRWSKQDISCLFFFCFLSHKELENVLESSRERERERERDLKSSRKRKRKGARMGIRVWWRKNKRKKRKRNVWMKLKGKIIKRIRNDN